MSFAALPATIVSMRSPTLQGIVQAAAERCLRRDGRVAADRAGGEGERASIVPQPPPRLAGVAADRAIGEHRRAVVDMPPPSAGGIAADRAAGERRRAGFATPPPFRRATSPPLIVRPEIVAVTPL